MWQHVRHRNVVVSQLSLMDSRHYTGSSISKFYYFNCFKQIIQELTWAMKQSIGLSAPSLTVVFLFVFFIMRHFSVTLSRNTWKGDFPAKYSCHPLTLEKSNQSNPWLCQLGGGLQLFECVHFQKYFIAHHFTVGLWRTQQLLLAWLRPHFNNATVLIRVAV